VAVARHIHPDSDGQCAPRSLDGAIAALAFRQHGVVSRAQLLAAGLGVGAIDRRVAGGRLHPVHRGVFAVGHRVLSQRGRWMAAVLAGGDGAVLSYRSAAELWAIRSSARARVEITVPRHRRGRPNVEYHRMVLPADEVTTEEGIPVTTPARTLFDLAAVVNARQLDHALNEAEVRRLSSPTSLDALIARHPRRKGIQALKRALDLQRQRGETVLRSVFEAEFLDFIERYALPRPKTNEPLGDYFPDALWPNERVIVELDSFGIHATRQTFESDRAKDRALTLAGYMVLRVTWRQLTTEPDRIAEQLSAALATPTPRSARHARPPSRATRSAAP
jgi:very-short-patch-repair endonuclease